MKIASSEVVPILTRFIDSKVMPKANPLQKFVIAYMLAQRSSELEELANLAAGKDGYIDTNALRAALDKAGGRLTLPYINWTVDAQDIADIEKLATS